MSILKYFPTILSEFGNWLSINKEWLFAGAGAVVLGGLFGFVRRLRTKPHLPERPPNSAPLVTVRNNDLAAAKAIDVLSQELTEKNRKLEEKDQALADAQQREQGLQTDLAALKEAIAAIPKQTEIPNARARIKEALAAATKGNTALAEAIFSEVEARKIAEGKAAKQSAYKETAEAARHRGALAFLHDTNKAIAAYRRATELDPENADGWNQLGRLLRRTGALDDAEAAYRKVESLGNAKTIRSFWLSPTATWAMSIESAAIWIRLRRCTTRPLAIDVKLGRKEGMASDYGNLGALYQIRYFVCGFHVHSLASEVRSEMVERLRS